MVKTGSYISSVALILKQLPFSEVFKINGGGNQVTASESETVAS